MGKNKKIIGLVLSSSFLVFILSCAAMKNFLSTPEDFLGSYRINPADKEVAQFISNVRPYQGKPDSHYLLACYYQERGNHKEAIGEFKKALSIDPEYIKAYNGLGISYDLLGDFPKAIESYKRALKLNPALDYLHNNLGYSYLLQGKWEEAVSAFKKSISLNNQDHRFHDNLALAYAEKGWYDLALFEFKLAGDEAKAYFNLAQLYFRKGLYKEAKDQYAKALNLDPSSTIFRTKMEAMSALNSIFQGDAAKARTEDLVVAEGPPAPEKTRKEESKTQVALQPTTSGQEKMDLHTPPAFLQTGIGLEKAKEILKPKNFPKVAGIEISNGNGVKRMAGRVGNYLQQKGLKVVRLTNADKFNYPDTRIFYKQGYQEAANQLAEQLPAVQSIEERRKLDRGNIQIKVLIGRDLIPHNKLFKNRGRS